MRPKKSLSQNFLSDPSILGRIIDTAGIVAGDRVLEVGPGPGSMTRLLLQSVGEAGSVVAVELDRELARALRAEYGEGIPGGGRFELYEGDILRFPLEEHLKERFKVVANIPYHITTPIMFKLLEESGGRMRSMTLTVQREVAERVVAGPGSKDFGVLSLMVAWHGRARLAFVIPAGAFRPRPKVDSACLHIEVHERPPVEVSDSELMFKVIRTVFTMRRKTLLNGLRQLLPEPGEAQEVLKAAGVEAGVRPEKLGLGEYAAIADAIKGRTGSD